MGKKNKLTVRYVINVVRAENLPETCTKSLVYLEWQRGFKAENKGDGKRMMVKSIKKVVFDKTEKIEIVSTVIQDATTGKYLTKEKVISISLKCAKAVKNLKLAQKSGAKIDKEGRLAIEDVGGLQLNLINYTDQEKAKLEHYAIQNGPKPASLSIKVKAEWLKCNGKLLASPDEAGDGKGDGIDDEGGESSGSKEDPKAAKKQAKEEKKRQQKEEEERKKQEKLERKAEKKRLFEEEQEQKRQAKEAAKEAKKKEKEQKKAAKEDAKGKGAALCTDPSSGDTKDGVDDEVDGGADDISSFVASEFVTDTEDIMTATEAMENDFEAEEKMEKKAKRAKKFKNKPKKKIGNKEFLVATDTEMSVAEDTTLCTSFVNGGDDDDDLMGEDREINFQSTENLHEAAERGTSTGKLKRSGSKSVKAETAVAASPKASRSEEEQKGEQGAGKKEKKDKDKKGKDKKDKEKEKKEKKSKGDAKPKSADKVEAAAPATGSFTVAAASPAEAASPVPGVVKGSPSTPSATETAEKGREEHSGKKGKKAKKIKKTDYETEVGVKSAPVLVVPSPGAAVEDGAEGEKARRSAEKERGALLGEEQQVSPEPDRQPSPSRKALKRPDLPSRPPPPTSDSPSLLPKKDADGKDAHQAKRGGDKKKSKKAGKDAETEMQRREDEAKKGKVEAERAEKARADAAAAAAAAEAEAKAKAEADEARERAAEEAAAKERKAREKEERKRKREEERRRQEEEIRKREAAARKQEEADARHEEEARKKRKRDEQEAAKLEEDRRVRQEEEEELRKRLEERERSQRSATVAASAGVGAEDSEVDEESGVEDEGSGKEEPTSEEEDSEDGEEESESDNAVIVSAPKASWAAPEVESDADDQGEGDAVEDMLEAVFQSKLDSDEDSEDEDDEGIDVTVASAAKADSASQSEPAGSGGPSSGKGPLVIDSQWNRQGFLVKRGHFFKTWKRRWFIFNQGVVRYFETQTCEKLLGEFAVDATYLVEQKVVYGSIGAPNEFCFQVAPESGKPFYMCASNEEQMNDWITSIQGYIDALRRPQSRRSTQIFEPQDADLIHLPSVLCSNCKKQIDLRLINEHSTTCC
mmetsp:Transcript_7309/g.20780  ORF Transcript_7309/g.20780 Transcript_7309/m.20780 type:complete len:1096 (-) Transcript_7309:716-4003(-)|eukprot:CAMPEP_0119157276 /NCGR_PEP_ID=MMETSP1310-20130426/52676_1 /TAXON_ID=464262 /ORGANISM="Genus nov. species nov., Strain RCC2339" /LENGTH=1095 /DNA_ID=CAMNT_0007149891 /DNA_START=73 /DNA_END=3360 /DNA_ORIENTATION=+